MNKTTLRAIYPEAELHSYPATDHKYLSIPDHDGFLWISKAELSKKEIALLTILTDEAAPIVAGEHLWYQVLFQQKALEEKGRFRVIQLMLQTPKNFLEDVWQENIVGIFPETADFFFLTPEQAILVEKQAKHSLSKEELAGIFLALDDDFETVSRVFVGGFHESSDAFPALFEEEQDIFKEEVKRLKRTTVFGIADVALHYFTKEALAKSSLTRSMKEEWRIDDEMKEIIQALWTNQGNLSSTAKELFMHRNTLQYRLEKFQEQTGMQLKNTEDLILCYLLLTN
ncbi:helix-turn-helix domain-containing protein [Enterococcus sp. BWR-S5]|uniref:helix-turn-helix domain-containing protein n=1 Tax=Enterococcus sp. BWR-S5 TaxID=2787714 RepID=UPI0019249BBE|nr:helix-turn-helix domain-containing protein [Enterococcus sp. BWR-S5]MBL1226659.1 helix-turn-helix domain-containing protein [Enterococcus sp. BWR-S5]